MKKMDHDKDGRASFSDYVETVRREGRGRRKKKKEKKKKKMKLILKVRREPLLLEAFGPCLPTSRSATT